MENQNNNFINTNATETNSSNGFKSAKPNKGTKVVVKLPIVMI